MTISKKAAYIKDNGIQDLANKDWWANDPSKEDVWAIVSASNETPTPDNNETPTPEPTPTPAPEEKPD